MIFKRIYCSSDTHEDIDMIKWVTVVLLVAMGSIGMVGLIILCCKQAHLNKHLEAEMVTQ